MWRGIVRAHPDAATLLTARGVRLGPYDKAHGCFRRCVVSDAAKAFLDLAETPYLLMQAKEASAPKAPRKPKKSKEVE